MGAWIALLLLVVAAMVLLLRPDAASIAGFDPSDLAIGFASVALLIFIGSSLAATYRGRAKQAARDLVAWLSVAVVLLGAYSYRNELLGLGHRVAGELLPPGTVLRSEPQVVGERAVRIRKRPDGHFIVKTEANGIAVSMLVDTGASTVVLRPADAQKLGFDVNRLRYSIPVQTANGTTYAASVRLRNLAVGNIVLQDVEALVARPGTLRDNLLGMSFLSRLRSYEFTSEYLTLRS
jgi:aspartyl protease family protein